jgi:prolyl-tRNA synthetase
VIPIFKDEDDKNSLITYLASILPDLHSKGYRIYEDWRKGSPGFKFNEWEMKGVPIRLEVGPKDLEKGQAVIVRRDTGEKQFIKKNDIAHTISTLLEDIQATLFEEAKVFRSENTHVVSSYNEFKDVIANQGGFVRCGWDGTEETEKAIKAETKATIRVIPFNEDTRGLTCIYSGNAAKHEVIFAKAY